MNLTLLLHVEREVAFPTRKHLNPVLCILQIKHFKIIVPNFLLRREKCVCVCVLFLFLFKKKPWIHAFIPFWKLNYNIAQSSLFHYLLLYPSSLLNFTVGPLTFQIYLLSSWRPSSVHWKILSLLPPSGPTVLQGEVHALLSLLFCMIKFLCFAMSHFSYVLYLFYSSWYVNQLV